MSTASASPNMSEIIRSYGNEHGVFGADEIRRLHGHKAAQLCSRLAKKGQFSRIKNGVYSMLDSASSQDEAYERYLERIAANREEDAKGDDAKLIDHLISWMKQNGSVSLSEAKQHFGREMKGMLSSYYRRGIFDRKNGRYSYAGEKPAERRETRPKAVPTEDEANLIFEKLSAIPRMTAKQIGENADISPVRLKDVLEHLVQGAKVVRHEPISTAAKATYSLSEDKAPTTFKTLSNEMTAALAMTASHGSMSARRLATHHLDNEATLLPNMEAYGLVERGGEDAELGGANFVITDFGIETLDSCEWKWRGLPAIANRPVHRAILALSEQGDGTSIAEIREDTGATRFIAEMAVTQLKDEGLIKVAGKPLIITRIQK